jgi:hypothetical protein
MTFPVRKLRKQEDREKIARIHPSALYLHSDFVISIVGTFREKIKGRSVDFGFLFCYMLKYESFNETAMRNPTSVLRILWPLIDENLYPGEVDPSEPGNSAVW